jgi:hypothetical protein
MKRQTTKKGAAMSRKELEKRWLYCWNNLEQDRIRRWVKRIPTHIKEIIRLEGGNKYIEGSNRVSWRNRWRNRSSLSED